MSVYSRISAPGGGALSDSYRPESDQALASGLGMKWLALDDAIGVAGLLAGIEAELMRAEVRDFPAVMHNIGGWRQQKAEEGIDDLVAIMEPGLAALLALHARGINPAVPARALWQEFHAARSALLALSRRPLAW